MHAADASAFEQAVRDGDLAAAEAGEDTDLVIAEADVVDREVGTLEPYSGPVAVRHTGALEREIADGDVVAAQYKDGFLLADLVGHRGGAFTDDGEVVAADDGAVEILAGTDQDSIAIMGGAKGV